MGGEGHLGRAFKDGRYLGTLIEITQEREGKMIAGAEPSEEESLCTGGGKSLREKQAQTEKHSRQTRGWIPQRCGGGR